MQKSNLQITSEEINDELVRIKLENFKKIEQMDITNGQSHSIDSHLHQITSQRYDHQLFV